MAGAILSGPNFKLFFFLCFLWPAFVSGQRGGERVFEFVHLPTSARATALGGSQIAAITNDYGLVGGNPGLLHPLMSQTFLFQYNFHFAGIHNGYAGYAAYVPGWKSMIHGGVHYMNYGTFTAADEQGNKEGEFKAKDLALQAGISKVLNERMSAGVTLQYIQSSLESYTANGIMLDAGLSYASEDGFNHYAFVLRGVGFQMGTYYEGDSKGKMPVDLQIGYSKRFKHVPFRLSILAHDLNRWNLEYDSPLDEQTDLGFGEDTPDEESGFSQWVDNFFKHMTFGGEILIGKNETVVLRVAYDYQKHQELSVVNLRSLAGFSGGVGINFKRFVLDYGFAVYHQAGSSKHLGLRIPLNTLEAEEL